MYLIQIGNRKRKHDYLIEEPSHVLDIHLESFFDQIGYKDYKECYNYHYSKDTFRNDFIFCGELNYSACCYKVVTFIPEKHKVHVDVGILFQNRVNVGHIRLHHKAVEHKLINIYEFHSSHFMVKGSDDEHCHNHEG